MKMFHHHGIFHSMAYDLLRELVAKLYYLNRLYIGNGILSSTFNSPVEFVVGPGSWHTPD